MADRPYIHGKRGRRRGVRWIIALAAMAAVLILGLAVGLAVGLTRHQHPHPTSYGTPTPSSVAPPAGPTSNGTWQPAVGSSWQIVLQKAIDVPASATSVSPNVDVFDIDLFTNPDGTIQKLHQLGKKVICYFSAGSYEPDRPDSSQFQTADKGHELSGWPGEYWLNLSSPNVRQIMTARIALAASKGCDAIDPDNVDGYGNDNGLGLTEQDSINFVEFLSSQAVRHNLTLGLKNAGEIINSVLGLVQFSVNEQCVQHSECTTFQPFIAAGKPVFHIEYPSGAPNPVDANSPACSTSGTGAGSDGFSTVLKDMALDGWVEYCNGNTASTGVLS